MKLSWKILCVLFIFFLLIPVHSQAQEQQKSGKDSTVQILLEKVQRLEKRTQSLEAQQQQSELQKLREEAQTAAVEQSKEEKKTKVFRGGQRALQAINPEISVTGDFLSHYIAESPHHAGLERSGNNFRVLGLHFRSDLDPFSYTKIAVEIHPKGAELGEAYAVWSGQIPGFSFMAGKFRQQFGVVNRWHAHSLDQIFFPPAIQELFGPEGLNRSEEHTSELQSH